MTLNRTVTVTSEDYASGEGREFYIYFRLPDGMRVSQSDGESAQPDAMPNGKWRIYNADGEVAGAFSFDEYEPNPEGERNERKIYAPIFRLFDIEGGYKRLISNATYEIATAAVKRDGRCGRSGHIIGIRY